MLSVFLAGGLLIGLIVAVGLSFYSVEYVEFGYRGKLAQGIRRSERRLKNSERW